jgi:hypothetical protein
MFAFDAVTMRHPWFSYRPVLVKTRDGVDIFPGALTRRFGVVKVELVKVYRDTPSMENNISDPLLNIPLLTMVGTSVLDANPYPGLPAVPETVNTLFKEWVYSLPMDIHLFPSLDTFTFARV